ncbi:MAG: hypothetical protein M5R36_26095 [Deltaproteobacteria bacterium]|nr:hypothetical protein [Deltaproteobacteria bacterium]
MTITDVRTGYKFYGEILPAFEIRVLTAEGGEDLTVVVNADTGAVLDVVDNIDRAPGDTYDVNAWGYAMDNEAGMLCNEPAFRYRMIDNSYSYGTARAAFNPDIHVYDLDFSYPNSFSVTPLYSNDQALWYKIFNYRITNDCYQFTCRNDDGTVIDRGDIGTFTAFNLSLFQFNSYVAMGYAKNGGNYPTGHNLTVIVNRDPDVNIAGGDDSDFCSGETTSCFRERGFPRTDGENYDSFSPYYAVDQYSDGDWRPTMIVEFRNNEGLYTESVHLPLVFHEFTHYIQKRYNISAYGPYTRPDDFLSDEGEAVKEGFAYFMAASFEDEGPHNYYRRSLRCNSDDEHDCHHDPAHELTWTLQYETTFQCCGNGHNGGYLVAQILWDLREGIGASALGKDYTQLLAFQDNGGDRRRGEHAVDVRTLSIDGQRGLRSRKRSVSRRDGR